MTRTSPARTRSFEIVTARNRDALALVVGWIRRARRFRCETFCGRALTDQRARQERRRISERVWTSSAESRGSSVRGSRWRRTAARGIYSTGRARAPARAPTSYRPVERRIAGAGPELGGLPPVPPTPELEVTLVQDPGCQGSGPLLLHLPQEDLGSQLRRRNPHPGLDLGIAVGEFRLEPGLPGCELHGH